MSRKEETKDNPIEKMTLNEWTSFMHRVMSPIRKEIQRRKTFKKLLASGNSESHPESDCHHSTCSRWFRKGKLIKMVHFLPCPRAKQTDKKTK